MITFWVFLRDLGQCLEIHQVIVQPLPIRACLRDRLFQLFIADNATFLGIDQEHAPRLQALLDEHALRWHVEHTYL